MYLPVGFMLVKVGSFFRGGDKLQMPEIRMLRKIFVANKFAVYEQLGWVHNEELCRLYRSPAGVMVVKSRSIGCTCRWREIHTGFTDEIF
jgi:hypothetical protein